MIVPSETADRLHRLHDPLAGFAHEIAGDVDAEGRAERRQHRRQAGDDGAPDGDRLSPPLCGCLRVGAWYLSWALVLSVRRLDVRVVSARCARSRPRAPASCRRAPATRARSARSGAARDSARVAPRRSAATSRRLDSRAMAARVLGPISPSASVPTARCNKPHGAGDAVIDRRVEVEEGERRGQLGAVRRRPVAREIDVAHRRFGNAPQLRLAALRDRACVERHALPVGEHLQRDAAIGRPAGIVRIVGEAAFHFQDVRERWSNSAIALWRRQRRVGCGAGCRLRPAKPEQPRLRESRDAHRIALVAAEQHDVAVGLAEQKPDVPGRGIAAAAQARRRRRSGPHRQWNSARAFLVFPGASTDRRRLNCWALICAPRASARRCSRAAAGRVDRLAAAARRRAAGSRRRGGDADAEAGQRRRVRFAGDDGVRAEGSSYGAGDNGRDARSATGQPRRAARSWHAADGKGRRRGTVVVHAGAAPGRA